MFCEFETLRGETMFINTDKILLIGSDKKGAMLVMDDGNLFVLKQSYAEVKQILTLNYNENEPTNFALQS